MVDYCMGWVYHMVDTRQTLSKEVGDKLQVGEADGNMGSGEVELITAGTSKDVAALIRLRVILDASPPPPSPVTVAVALTRSKTFPKILETLTVLGVKKIYILNTARVEPGYWHTHTLQPEAIRERLTLGLEQTVDTIYPDVILCKSLDRFIVRLTLLVLWGCSRHRGASDPLWWVAAAPLVVACCYCCQPNILTPFLLLLFVSSCVQEKQVPGMLVPGATNLIAHPDVEGEPGVACPHDVAAPCNLLIGPEGGFLDPEVARFTELGFTTVGLGTRILPVQTAVHVLLGKLGY
jgi:16S rRNA U1498 N3-methylase RsmE